MYFASNFDEVWSNCPKVSIVPDSALSLNPGQVITWTSDQDQRPQGQKAAVSWYHYTGSLLYIRLWYQFRQVLAIDQYTYTEACVLVYTYVCLFLFACPSYSCTNTEATQQGPATMLFISGGRLRQHGIGLKVGYKKKACKTVAHHAIRPKIYC